MDYQLYPFPAGTHEYPADAVSVLGGKGLHLHNMCKLGLPVPPGMVIPTPYCNDYLASDDLSYRQGMQETLASRVQSMLSDMSPEPRLVSIRSGSAVSMPGMMDTVLNVGITKQSLPQWREALGDRTALDCYRRLIQMFTNVVHGVPSEVFESLLSEVRIEGQLDSDLSVPQLLEVVDKFEGMYEMIMGEKFPQTVQEQIASCIGAVFNSWNSDRAMAYRNAHNISHDLGTAVTVQHMVFGNLNDNSCSGVMFTRNPITGENSIYGEFLPNAQGEDVVSGIRTPLPLSDMMGSEFNDAAIELVTHSVTLESHYRDMQDMEFTVEDGKLYILQTRTGKRSAEAAFQIAWDYYSDGYLTLQEALSRVTVEQHYSLLTPRVDPNFKTLPFVTGIPASGNVVTGRAVFSAQAAKGTSGPCILIAHETTPEDFEGMVASVGILTATGGTTSHAAVVARGMDKTCVVGCTDLSVDEHDESASRLGEYGKISKGDQITLDGRTGRVWVNCAVEVTEPGLTPAADDLLSAALSSDAHKKRIDFDLSDNRKEWKNEINCTLPKEAWVGVCLDSIGKGGLSRFAVGQVLLTLKAREGLVGTILLGARKLSNEDARLLSFFGMEDSQPTEQDLAFLLEQVGVLEQARWTKGLKNRFSIEVPNYATKEVTDRVLSAGWGILTQPSEVAELLNATGMIRIAPELKDRLKKLNTPLGDILTLLNEAGRGVQIEQEARTYDELIFEVLSA